MTSTSQRKINLNKNEELKLKLIRDRICVDPLTPINKTKLVCDATFPQPLEQITC